MADVVDVFGEDDEEGPFWEAGVVDFFAGAYAGDVEGFFVARFDCVWFGSGLVVAHVFDGFEGDAVFCDVVVEAIHAYTAFHERGVADDALFVYPFCGFLFLFECPSLVDGGFFYWRPERVSALFDGGACSGDKDLADGVPGFGFVEGDGNFGVEVVDAAFELFEAGDGDVEAHGI